MRRIDWPLIAANLALCALGWLVLFSVTGQDVGPRSEAFRQAVAIALGLGLAFAMMLLDYDTLGRMWRLCFVACLLILAVVMLPGVGYSAKGAQRWIDLGPAGTFQPSETAKLLMIIFLARFLARRAQEHPRRRVGAGTSMMALGLAAIPCALVALQPDLGTALVLMAITFTMLFVAGTSPILLAAVVVSGLGAAPYLLHDYQWNRLVVFLSPESDPDGMAYNLVQSKTAIGSGGVWGTGLFNGPMSQNHFVPENWTDFIFTAVGEELGLIGCLGLLALFGIVLLRMLRAALGTRELFGTLLCVGIAAMFAFQVFENVGMTVGLMPVAGIPLPLVSYGGSAMLTNWTAIGMVLSVAARSR